MSRPWEGACVSGWAKLRSKLPWKAIPKRKCHTYIVKKQNIKSGKEKKKYKKSVCCHHTKELPKAFKQREKRREAFCANLVASPNFATKATVSPCVGVTWALVFVRTILIPLLTSLVTPTPLVLCFGVCFHHFGLITILDILTFGFFSTFDNRQVCWFLFALSTYPPTTIEKGVCLGWVKEVVPFLDTFLQ